MFIALVALAALRAWTCDDALITFRVAGQVLAGEGPVFNVGERVQVFTHPLWLMFLTAIAALGVPLFPGAMWASVIVFAAGLAAIFFAFRDKPVALATAGTMLFFSRAGVDFATGGLETPLTFALFAAAVHALRSDHPRVALVWLALLPLNRLDLLPWALPFAILALPRGSKGSLLGLAAVAAPAALWIAFSTVYFGDPLPNTANAKLAEGFGGRIGQGLGYVVASLASDAGAMALVGCATALMAAGGRRSGATRDGKIALAAAASMAIGLAYAAWSGGDFMLGRFLLPAVWAATLVVLAAFPGPAESSVRIAAACVATLGGLLFITGESTTTLWLDVEPDSPYRTWEAVGALDERREYLPWYGAFARHPIDPVDEPRTATPHIASALGRPGYFGERRQPVVDLFALADPLLARMKPLANSRPGHGYRPYPREFWRWRESGFSFADARLDRLSADLRLAHLSSELWTSERARAIARLASTRHIDPGVVTTTDEGARIRIDLNPAAIFRPWDGAELYQVWLRRYEEKDLGFGVRFPVAIGADCAPHAVAGELGDFPAIAVPRGNELSLACDKAALGDTPIVMRVGARGPDGAMRYDEPIPIFRPSLWWLGAVGKWLTHGWSERPLAAAIEGALLVALAALLGWRTRRRP